MRKPAFAICKQQKCRSACASVQFDHHLYFHCLDSIISLVSISEISSLQLASVAAQAGLSLTWWKTPKTGFLVTRLICGSALESFFPGYKNQIAWIQRLLTRTADDRAEDGKLYCLHNDP